MKALYDLHYYARHLGYAIIRKEKVAVAPVGKRSRRVEQRLKGYGYNIQLNLFADFNPTGGALALQDPENRGG